jgi:hypothetical protein
MVVVETRDNEVTGCWVGMVLFLLYFHSYEPILCTDHMEKVTEPLKTAHDAEKHIQQIHGTYAAL